MILERNEILKTHIIYGKLQRVSFRREIETKADSTGIQYCTTKASTQRKEDIKAQNYLFLNSRLLVYITADKPALIFRNYVKIW